MLSPDDDSPAAKRKKTDITEFFGKKTDGVGKKSATAAQPRKVSKSMKPASPKAKEKKAAAIRKKRIADSDEEEGDEEGEFDDLPKPPPRKGARDGGMKSKYVELSSEDENGDDSMFMDD